MEWKLIELQAQDEPECTLDDSGVYVVVNRVVERETHKEYAGERVRVRADIMTASDEPLISFLGSASHVRKVIAAWLTTQGFSLSLEHASYIGSELMRAELDPRFVQD